ncbi:hypothetical protein HPC62_03515 [Thermoleptolyngbya sichuanensis A183]|uniref:Uncharacterized protein n=1 Tax=Thermoleptolyngbya sichuanensis A183 TaxID=2737172 RepID=A0A6M8B4P2_9CYAN|nr:MULTISPECIES: hypothetical protein [Thermoleptolyngbya]MDG2616720.1 hypothetical protein [Thermoleptolyngbya sichuanensis XZ-Cy5]QKD81368.1 hypothetical protein HPC62_03515 [Thermoleptolyngbya sichuanensis A183]
MSPLMLRHLWMVVDEAQSSVLLSLDDHSLTKWLIGQFYQGRSLSPSESDLLSEYIRTRIPLIREMAQGR